MPEIRNILNVFMEASSLMEVGMMFLDENGHIAAVNEQISNELGYKREDLKDKTIFEINPFLNLFTWKKNWKELLSNGKVSFESEHINRDGRMYPIRLRGILTEIKGRKLCCAFVVNLLSASRYKDLLEHLGQLSKIGGWEWDLLNDELIVTDQMYQIMGVDPKETTIDSSNARQIAKSLLGEDGYTYLYEEIAKCIKDQEPTKTELKVNYADGTSISVEITAKPIFSEGGTTKIFGSVRNNSEEKEKIQPLELTQFTMDHSSEMIFWVREDGLFEYINNSALKTLGYSESEAHSLNEYTILGISKKEWAKQWKELKEQKESSHITFKYRKDGTPVPVEVVINFIEHEGRTLMCKYARDISDVYSSKKELESAKFTVDNAVEMIFWMDEKGKLTYANKAASRITGYSEDELLTMSTFDLNSEIPKAKWKDHWQKVKEEGSFSKEMYFQRKSGEKFPVFIEAQHLEFDGHEYHCAFVRDYSRKKEKDSLIQLSMHTLNQSFDMIYWLTEDTKFHYFNDSFKKFFGYSDDELANLDVFDFFPNATKKTYADAWKKLKAGVTIRGEREVKNRKGEMIPVEILVSLVKFDNKEFACAYLRDITDRKKTEETIRKSEERFRSVVSSATDAIITADENGHILTWNEGAQKVFGWKASEILGKNLTEIMPVDFRESHKNGFDRYLKSEKPQVIGKVVELQGRRKSGENFPVEISLGTWMSDEKHHFCGIIRDISERKAREEELKNALEEISELKQKVEMENTYLQSEIDLSYNFNNIISSSKNYRKILSKVEQVADTDATVLVLGETGTGKELLARAIHKLSSRGEKQLIKVNCAALPENLFESELFGHEKGSFTGAYQRKTGRFELADKGTIFLDEIGEMPLDMQTKLLRVLQEGEFERVGGTQTIKVDVRVIAATNRDLEKEVQDGNFREDLYYRLNVFPIFNLPLRDRREDIPLLVSHFVQKYSDKMNKSIDKIPQPIIEKFYQYQFPGNIRELENIIERAVIITKGNKLEVDFGFLKKKKKGKSENGKTFPTFEEAQRDHIIKALKLTNGRVSGDLGAARLLGVHDKTLFSKMKKLGINKDEMANSD
ncbi:MAG: PAS domain S-box protein [Saprospiraceae bacterium]